MGLMVLAELLLVVILMTQADLWQNGTMEHNPICQFFIHTQRRQKARETESKPSETESETKNPLIKTDTASTENETTTQKQTEKKQSRNREKKKNKKKSKKSKKKKKRRRLKKRQKSERTEKRTGTLREKLVLIDGHSILNRAFYGVPELTNSEGLHTNAVYGFKYFI